LIKNESTSISTRVFLGILSIASADDLPNQADRLKGGNAGDRPWNFPHGLKDIERFKQLIILSLSFY
jgi:hypothetical protein